MDKFYYLHFNDFDNGGVATAIDLPDPSLINLSTIINGSINFSAHTEELQDYQANDLGLPLMSEKMKTLFDQLVVKKCFRWNKVEVRKNNAIFHYFMPSFLDQLDVLDMEKTKFIDGSIGLSILKPCLSLEKVRELDFFPIPNSEVKWIVSEMLKKSILLNRLSGVDFSNVPTSV